MSEPAVRVEGLSKRYTIGLQRGRGDGLRHAVENAVRNPRQWLRGRQGSNGATQEEFWALQDVSFDIAPGEVVGIIGRNGAGKSTLLKILSRITEPTLGRVCIEGRVASLLEVGTGFHPELTGRENIFLNGAIMGMSRVEIKQKFDAIVAFSEVEKFLDTPVKRYSSGMYVRLAFAVAAHLEPEILIVDEVLAVGDVQFQKKCLGKMQNVARGGRTVLFVSHNLGAVRQLCSRGLLLRQGRVVAEGTAHQAIDAYLAAHESSGVEVAWDPDRAPATSYMRFCSCYLLGENGERLLTVDAAKAFTVCLEYEALRDTPNLRVGFLMQTGDGIPVCGSNDALASEGRVRPAGFHRKYCRFPAHVLNAGTYQLCLGVDTPMYDEEPLTTEFCLAFTVEDHEGHGLRRERLPGLLKPKLEWQEEAPIDHEAAVLV